ncbi:hypothetical protein chiPu_0033697 [Chiloscyllium punctatum]|uniref:Uncharacterized protein n=1 Tax=Chiloscyllium punctatum TaxID=137246 RepID=A0A401U3Q7_CHIPU|nr:hypothetical protein [Chiloscyllium punctatum]
MRLALNKMVATAQVPKLNSGLKPREPLILIRFAGPLLDITKMDRTTCPTTGSIIPPGPPSPRHNLDTEKGVFSQFAHAQTCSIQRLSTGVFWGIGGGV